MVEALKKSIDLVQSQIELIDERMAACLDPVERLKLQEMRNRLVEEVNKLLAKQAEAQQNMLSAGAAAAAACALLYYSPY